MKLSTLHRRLATSRRGRHFAAASCALAFAAGDSGRSHARPSHPTKGNVSRPAGSAAVPPMHAMPTADGPGKLLRLEGVKINSQLENGRLVVNGMSGSVGGGRVKAAGRVDAGDKTGPQRLQAQFDDVDIREVLRLLDVSVASTGVSGVRADGVVNLKWRGMKQESIQRSLTGAAVVKTGPGTIAAGSPLIMRLADTAGIQNLETLNFSSARIDLSAQNGVVRLKSLVFRGDQFRLAASGTIDMRNETVDLVMDVDVTPTIAQRSKYWKMQSLASVFGRKKMEKTADGFVEVPRIVMAGNLREPEVEMDHEARVEPAIERANTAQTDGDAEVRQASGTDESGRQVALEDQTAGAKRVPLWRNMISGFKKSEDQAQ